MRAPADGCPWLSTPLCRRSSGSEHGRTAPPLLPSLQLTAAYDTLRQRREVPVLFVHGHLGTHQQMRSAAAETGRELARRLDADPAWPLWLQWYAADFAGEASALDAGLLVSGLLQRCAIQQLALPARNPAWLPLMRIQALPSFSSCAGPASRLCAALHPAPAQPAHCACRHRRRPAPAALPPGAGCLQHGRGGGARCGAPPGSRPVVW